MQAKVARHRAHKGRKKTAKEEFHIDIAECGLSLSYARAGAKCVCTRGERQQKQRDLQSPQHLCCEGSESKGKSKTLKYKLIIINSQYNLFHIRSHEMQIDRNFHTKY